MNALAAERARHDVTAFDWAETDEAQSLIARFHKIDEWYQAIALEVSSQADQAIYDDLSRITAELDHLRDCRIADEIAGLSEHDQEDDYLVEEIERSAPWVTTVLELNRPLARALAA